MPLHPVLRVALLGDAGVGKTTLLQKFMKEDCLVTNGDIADTQEKVVERNGRKIKLDIRDTAGLERYRSLTQSYYRGITNFIFVYDVNNKESFNNLMKWSEQYNRNCNDPVNTNILIVGNKHQEADTDRVPTEQARNFANHLEADFIEISTRNNTNIEACFLRIVDNYFERQGKCLRRMFSTPSIKLKYKSKKNSCCRT
ncbi:uncharacterized protein [Antedon mediterranea]|uniref:uncharacterized protein n=1 Tax=Antedon mediterranea TaxID=105859 RepID=UPI003AF8EE81